MWASASTKPAVVPAEALYYGTPILGSSFDVAVSPITMLNAHTEVGRGVSEVSLKSFELKTGVCFIFRVPVLVDAKVEAWLTSD